MSKTVRQVFLIIGTLVLIFLVWQLVFKEGGIVRTVYNGMVNGINGQWEKVAGDGQKILPSWGDTGADTGSKEKGFEIETD